MKKIILFQFDNRREKQFLNCLDQLQENYEVVLINESDELKKIDFKTHSLFYFFFKDLKQFEATMDFFQENIPTTAINIIFKRKDFDVLLRAFDYPVIEVLDKKFTPGQIQKALLKSELNQFHKNESDLPLKQISTLFSSPIKIKSDDSLGQLLTTYFAEFEANIEFGIIRNNVNTYEHVFGSSFYPEKINLILNEIEVNRFYIGQVVKFDVNQYATPVYNKKEKVSWLLFKATDETKNEIMNKYFFHFLENALIYRKGMDKRENFKKLAEKDDVTGLFNQRKLNQDLRQTIEEHENANQAFSVMFIDVDHFKKVNDNFGHVIGSKMLIGIGEILASELRGTDKIYRYGGDEFVVIMPKVSIEIVHKIALRVQTKMKEKIFNIDEAKDYKLSVSIGIAQYPTDAKTADEIINFADEMMYVSKKSGRGKIFHVGEITDDATGS